MILDCCLLLPKHDRELVKIIKELKNIEKHWGQH